MNQGRFFCVLLLAVAGAHASDTITAPENLRATFSESSIELTWDSVPGADGYNLYTAPRESKLIKKYRRFNANIITSGTRYTYLWDMVDGKHLPGIKGVEHHIGVTAVCSTGSGVIESRLSKRIDNRYLDGFCRMTSADSIKRTLRDSQKSPRLPLKIAPTTPALFMKFMKQQGRLLDSLLRATIDPQDVGGCSPIATITVQLMHDARIDALKAEGRFIGEYHAFVLVAIDSAEYVVDFSANQFIPDVTPVLLPRDFCFIGPQNRPAVAGDSLYTIARLYAWDQSDLSDKKESEPYRRILEQVRSATFGVRPGKK